MLSYTLINSRTQVSDPGPKGHLVQKLSFSNSFGNTIRVLKGSEPDQDRQKGGPDLGPKFMQMLSAEDKSGS